MSFIRQWTTKVSQRLLKLISWILGKLPKFAFAHSSRHSHQSISHVDRPSTILSHASTQISRCGDIRSETVTVPTSTSNTQATSQAQEAFIVYSDVPETSFKRYQTSAELPPSSRALATSTDSSSLTNIHPLGQAYSPPVSPTHPFSSPVESLNMSPTQLPHPRRGSGGTNHVRALSSGNGCFCFRQVWLNVK